MDKMREEYTKLFNEFADKYDQFSNQWQDMTIEEVFIQGCIASRAALVVQLPAQCETTHYQGGFEDGYESGYNESLKDTKENLLKAGIKCS